MEGRGKARASYKRTGVVLAAAVFLLALALQAYAPSSVTLDTLTWSQSTKIQINFTPTSDVDGVALVVASASTANSSAALVYNRSNSTVTFMSDAMVKRNLNETFGTNYTLEDANDYTATTYIYFNGTEASSTATVSIERTAPAAATGMSPSGTVTADDQTFSGTVTGADTTGCTLCFDGKNPGSVCYSMTHSANTCSVSLTNIAENSYKYYIQATDTVNTSTGETVTINMDLPDGRARRIAAAQIASQGGAGGSSRSAAAIKAPEPVKRGVENAKGTAETIKEGRFKEFAKKETTVPELAKTGGGAVIGGFIGAAGFMGGPLGFITMPVGALIGGGIGLVV